MQFCPNQVDLTVFPLYFVDMMTIFLYIVSQQIMQLAQTMLKKFLLLFGIQFQAI